VVSWISAQSVVTGVPADLRSVLPASAPAVHGRMTDTSKLIDRSAHIPVRDKFLQPHVGL
jgi:hypothetical protein